MALTKVSGGILDPGINVAGVVTATGFDGPFVGGTGDSINAGIITATGLDVNGNGDISGNLVVGGNLTANGDFTTLNTTLREVELLRVESNSSAVAGIITQSGSGDILKLYDSSTPVFVVKDGGRVGIGTDNPSVELDIEGASARIHLHDLDSNQSQIIQQGDSLYLNVDSEGNGSGSLRIRVGGNDLDAEKLRITSSGSVGIGTNNPGAELHVQSAVPEIRIQDSDGTNQYSQWKQVGGNSRLQLRNDSSNGSFSLQGIGSGTVTLIKVDGDGKVGLGTDPTNDKLEVAGSVKIKGNDPGSFHINPDSTGGTQETLIGQANGDLRIVGGSGVYQADRANILLKNTSKHIIINAETTNGRVGIGTDAPARDFHVTGTSRFEQLDVVGFATFGSAGTRFYYHTPQIEMPGTGTATISFCNATTGNTNSDGMLMGFSSSSQVGFINVNESAHGFVLKTGGTAQNDERIRVSGVGTVSIRRGTEEMVNARPNSAVELYHNGNKRLETTGTGVDITDTLNVAGVSTFSDTVKVGTGVTALADGNVSIGGTLELFNTTGDVLNNPSEIKISNLTISQHQNTGTYKVQNSNATGSLLLSAGGSGYGGLAFWNGNFTRQYLTARDQGSVKLFYNNTVRFATSGIGATVYGEIATSQDYPTQKPTLNFNFTASKKLDSRFSYERAGSASFIDKFGKIVLVGDNVPRFDHDPTTRESKGLLIEGTRTNYIPDSLNFRNAHWAFGINHPSNLDRIAVDNSVTNPDGSVGAYYRTSTDETYVNPPYCDLSGANTDTITVSLFVKERSGVSGGIDIEIFSQISPSAVSLGSFTFDPATATVTTADANFSDGRVQEFPNGWYRVSAKVTTNSGNFTSTTRMDIQSNTHYMWGPQVEAGSFPTSFIPTNGSATTRRHDKVFIDGDGFTEFYNPVESTVVCEFNSSNWLTYNDNAYERIWSINNGSESDVFEMFKQHTSNDVIRYRVRDGGANVLGAANITYGTNTIPKMAFALKLNDAAVAVDGTIAGTTDTGIPMPTVDRLIIGNDDESNTNSLHGHIRKFMYYPVKLPDSQVVTLTS